MRNNIKCQTSTGTWINSRFCFIIHITVLCNCPGNRSMLAICGCIVYLTKFYICSRLRIQQTIMNTLILTCPSSSEIKLAAYCLNSSGRSSHSVVADEPCNTGNDNGNQCYKYKDPGSQKNFPLLLIVFYLILSLLPVFLRSQFLLFLVLHCLYSPHFCFAVHIIRCLILKYCYHLLINTCIRIDNII